MASCGVFILSEPTPEVVVEHNTRIGITAAVSLLAAGITRVSHRTRGAGGDFVCSVAEPRVRGVLAGMDSRRRDFVRLPRRGTSRLGAFSGIAVLMLLLLVSWFVRSHASARRHRRVATARDSDPQPQGERVDADFLPGRLVRRPVRLGTGFHRAASDRVREVQEATLEPWLQAGFLDGLYGPQTRAASSGSRSSTASGRAAWWYADAGASSRSHSGDTTRFSAAQEPVAMSARRRAVKPRSRSSLLRSLRTGARRRPAEAAWRTPRGARRVRRWLYSPCRRLAGSEPRFAAVAGSRPKPPGPPPTRRSRR